MPFASQGCDVVQRLFLAVAEHWDRLKLVSCLFLHCSGFAFRRTPLEQRRRRALAELVSRPQLADWEIGDAPENRGLETENALVVVRSFQIPESFAGRLRSPQFHKHLDWSGDVLAVMLVSASRFARNYPQSVRALYKCST